MNIICMGITMDHCIIPMSFYQRLELTAVFLTGRSGRSDLSLNLGLENPQNESLRWLIHSYLAAKGEVLLANPCDVFESL